MATTHSLSKTREYSVRHDIRVGRHYGKIPVCDRWQSFENFYADMGPRPSPKHSIDRIDNAGIYEPGNCRWTTNTVQARNRRNNIWVEFQGRRMVLSEAVALAGADYFTVHQRIKKLGWPVEKALTTPSQRKQKLAPGEVDEGLAIAAAELGFGA